MSVLLAFALGFWVFTIGQGKDCDWLFALCSTLTFIATLLPSVGVHYESTRLGVNVRIVSVLFLIVSGVFHFCFAAFGTAFPHYVVASIVLLIIYLLIWHKIANIKDI